MLTRIPKPLLVSAAIALAASALALLSLNLKSVRDLEEVSYDIRALAFAPETKPSDEVVMIWLDEATMKGLAYRSPVPRDFLAGLHERIEQAGPLLTGYDIFFADPSFPEADRALARSLEGTVAFSVVPRRPDGSVDMPLPMFEQALTGVGLADLPFNPFDAVVRRARLSFDTASGRTNTFAAALFLAATGVRAEDAVAEAAVPPGGRLLAATPFLADGATFIRFAGPPGRVGAGDNAFKTYSASLVSRGLVPAAWLADKIVLVGASYEDLKDAYLTPYYAGATDYARMNGVEIHANILSSLLTGQFYFVPGPGRAAAMVFLAALSTAMLAACLSPVRSIPASVGAAAAWAGIAAWSFKGFALVLPMAAPLIAQGVSVGAGLAWRALTEGRQRRFIRGVFARYVPASVVDRMLKEPSLLRLGGELRQVTSLFSDVASFTSISERMDPETLVAFLNDYLGSMNGELFKHGATLDKYEGDAIIAFFNAPLDVAGHEEAAALAALGMQATGRQVSARWRDRCGVEITTRIGINTGPAVVGNMGSEGRFDYTAIGDTINLASRLEGANKFYGTSIMAGEATAAGLGEGIVRRPLDRVRVKGKSEPILIYEIAGTRAEVGAREAFASIMERYIEAFGLFEKRRIAEARQILEEITGRHPDDGPSLELMKRCARAEAEPEWDLVTDFMTK